MSTIFQKYGASIASFLVVLLTALSVLPAKPTTVDLLQLVVLILSAVGVFWVPLLKGKWAAGGKVGVELASVLLVTLIPFFVGGTPTREQIVVILIALIKAGATQLGVLIRTDVPVAGGLVPDPASVGKHVA
jgi:ABC-type sugar transport system substrate-binding protein